MNPNRMMIADKFSRNFGLGRIAKLVADGVAAGLSLTSADVLALENGSFESPEIPPGSVLFSATPNGWTTIGVSNNQMFHNPGGTWPDAEDGLQYAAIHSSLDRQTQVGLLQSFEITTEGDYWLTWFDNAALNVAGAPYAVSIIGPSPVVDVHGPPLGAVDWAPRTLLLQLEPGDYTLAFRPTGGAGVTLLDHVELTAASPTSVPDGGSVFYCLVTSLCLVAFAARKRSTRSAKTDHEF